MPNRVSPVSTVSTRHVSSGSNDRAAVWMECGEIQDRFRRIVPDCTSLHRNDKP
jgi:hypothetical protein